MSMSNNVCGTCHVGGVISFVHPSQPLEEENNFQILGAWEVKLSRVWTWYFAYLLLHGPFHVLPGGLNFSKLKTVLTTRQLAVTWLWLNLSVWTVWALVMCVTCILIIIYTWHIYTFKLPTINLWWVFGGGARVGGVIYCLRVCKLVFFVNVFFF